MKCNNAVLLLASATIIVVFSGEVFGMPPAQCSPGFLDEIPPRIRKVCAALSTLYELGTAMENYIEDKVASSVKMLITSFYVLGNDVRQLWHSKRG